MAVSAIVTDAYSYVSRSADAAVMLTDAASANNETDELATTVLDPVLSLNEKYPTGVTIGRAISTIVLTVGFPGNFLSALIWLRLTLRDRTSSGIYLMALAISDSVFLTAYLLQVLYSLWQVRLLSCPSTFGVCYVALMSSHYLSVILVLAFNVDRFLAITYPLKVSFLVREPHAV